MFITSFLSFILLWFLTKSFLAAIIIDAAFTIIIFVIVNVKTRDLFTRRYEPSGGSDDIDGYVHISLYAINTGDNDGDV